MEILPNWIDISRNQKIIILECLRSTGKAISIMNIFNKTWLRIFEDYCDFWTDNHTTTTALPWWAVHHLEEEEEEEATTPYTVSYNATNDTDWDALFEDVRDTTDLDVIPFMSNAGIAFNIAVMLIMRFDRRIRRVTRVLLYTFLVIEIIYLVLLEVMLRLRDSTMITIDMMTYLSLACSVFQFVWIWMFFLLADEAYAAVACYYGFKIRYTLCDAIGYIILIMLFAMAFHVPFVPHIRMLLGDLDPNFNPCVLPVLDLWDARWKMDLSGDLYYVLYYYLAYVFVVHALPYFMIGLRIKDMVDILHAAKEQPLATRNMKHVANTAMFVYVMCSTNMVLHCTKLITLCFGVANHLLKFSNGETDAIRYFNVFGNFLFVSWTLTTLPVILHYNPRIRWMFCRVPCIRMKVVCLFHLRRLFRRAQPVVKTMKEQAQTLKEQAETLKGQATQALERASRHGRHYKSGSGQKCEADQKQETSL